LSAMFARTTAALGVLSVSVAAVDSEGMKMGDRIVIKPDRVLEPIRIVYSAPCLLVSMKAMHRPGRMAQGLRLEAGHKAMWWFVCTS